MAIPGCMHAHRVVFLRSDAARRGFIVATKVLDGVADCMDGSDEVDGALEAIHHEMAVVDAVPPVADDGGGSEGDGNDDGGMWAPERDGADGL